MSFIYRIVPSAVYPFVVPTWQEISKNQTEKFYSVQKFTKCNGSFGITLTKTAAPYDIGVPFFNLLKPTGYVTHHQFNIQQLYALPTLYLCVLYLSENKQRLVPLTA